MEEEFNPYAAPQTDARLVDEDARAIRMKNLRAESHVKAMGMLLVSGGMLGLLGSHVQAKVMEAEFGVSSPWEWTSALPVVLPVAGVGLFGLKRWGWMLAVLYYAAATVMRIYGAAFGGAVFEQSVRLVALLIAAVILMFLLREKTRRIFAANYPALVTATPDLRSPVATWGWVTALLCAVAALLFALGL